MQRACLYSVPVSPIIDLSKYEDTNQLKENFGAISVESGYFDNKFSSPSFWRFIDPHLVCTRWRSNLTALLFVSIKVFENEFRKFASLKPKIARMFRQMIRHIHAFIQVV